MSLTTLTAPLYKNKLSGHIHLPDADSHTAPFIAAGLAENIKDAPCVLVASNQQELEEFHDAVKFIAPAANILHFPAWDVQPYDRLSPDSTIQAQRLKTLVTLRHPPENTVVLTTVAALATKTPPADQISGFGGKIAAGQRLEREQLIKTLSRAGYQRVGTVMEAGEFAVRGALLDVFPAGEENPIRLDFFDDELETIKPFDAASQRSLGGDVAAITLYPACDIILNDETIATFRQNYLAAFPAGREDTLYKDVSQGVPHPQMGHFLPLFTNKDLASLFDVLPAHSVFLTLPSFDRAKDMFAEQVRDAYETRKTFMAEDAGEEPFRPLPPEALYLINDDLAEKEQRHTWLHITPRDVQASGKPFDKAIKLNLHTDLPLISQKTATSTTANLFAEKVRAHIRAGEHVVVTAFTASGAQRLERVLHDEGTTRTTSAGSWQEAEQAQSKEQQGSVTVLSAPLPWGFHAPGGKFLLLTEQDIYGEKQNTATRRPRRKGEEAIQSFSELTPGDYVVHAEHGIGKFTDLQTLNVGGDAQDFITLEYEGGDKLYVPVVSLDVLSRYSAEESGKQRLDRLGSAAWQARKAKVKKRLLDIADDLIKTVAERNLRTRPPYAEPQGLYDEFAAGFPYIPTPEQQQAIDDVKADMFAEKPMDRLVVGDVGFGKTEVAMRGAFIAAADGRQVAVVVPTTLLARQHLTEFKKRFEPFGIKVEGLSRLTATGHAKDVKKGLREGEVDIVVGTHALLGKNITFANLGLVVVDEEQRFGVTHKERLKQLRASVDVLTLTATPIPRTLHMSVSGLKQLSTITTPPVDRLAIRTFLMGFDSKVLREAVLREIYRDGQVYVVTPRVDGIEQLAEQLRKLVPEAKVRTAHGQMTKTELENAMADFYDGKFNVLVATTIIESGLDLPKANTMIVHRADRFGLAQLYQIRGRVGRSKTRAYAYLLLPPGGRMSETAHKRLQILRKLDYIGASFHLANYDMDMRGPGNILGAEQSGHIREVGFELYNQLLAEAIKQRQGGADSAGADEGFTPVLNVGLTYRIPEEYVPDLNTRMRLYRRISALTDDDSIEDLRAELLDRFGALPAPVTALLDVVHLRNKCRGLNIDKIETGEKGVVIGFYGNNFPAPQALLAYIMARPGLLSLRPDQKVVWHRRWPDSRSRLNAISILLDELSELVKEKDEQENNKKTG